MVKTTQSPTSCVIKYALFLDKLVVLFPLVDGDIVAVFKRYDHRVKSYK